MKKILVVLCIIAIAKTNAQNTSNSIVEKDSIGININAPKGVYQYAFRIGEWESTHKSLKSRNEWSTGTSHFKVYVAENGLTFIEEGLDDKGNIKHRITFDYVETTNSWKNHYKDLVTGREVDYTSKMVDGKLVEIIQRENNVNNNTYDVLQDNIYTYTAYRTYNNGFSLINHVGISTKKVVEPFSDLKK
ncbi:hypothetical protein [Thalassobellus citreus]|uniref:hypothetical protein n=1 Tax=Thalassobellus citreus TaxID=3367752 RepID=UPI0037B9CC56